MRALGLYVKFLGIAFRSRLQYRSDFLIAVVGVVVLNTSNLALIWALLQTFDSIGGWHYWEIAMLYSMWLMSHSINAVFFWHLPTLEDDILQGRFDQYLLRPCSPLLQFLGRELNYMGVGDSVVAIAIFNIAYANLGLEWSPTQWIFFVVSVVSGLVIETAIAWIVGTVAFWTGRSRSIYGATTRFNILAQQYPLDAFGLWFRVFVTGFLPVAFVNYYPLTVLLNKPNGLGWPILGYLSPLVAIVITGLGMLLWQQGLRQYTSSGN